MCVHAGRVIGLIEGDAMNEDDAIRLRDLALAIARPDGVRPPVSQDKMEQPLGGRLTIALKAPTDHANTLTIWNGIEQVLCVGWMDQDTPRIFYYEPGDWERELKELVSARASRSK
jgi:hypothetical protein